MAAIMFMARTSTPWALLAGGRVRLRLGDDLLAAVC
jgi:hypothetical protein